MRIWQRIFSRRRDSAELSDEMRGHLAERVDELVAGGMERSDAEHHARREFGNFSLIAEKVQDLKELCEKTEGQLAEWIGNVNASLLHGFLHQRA